MASDRGIRLQNALASYQEKKEKEAIEEKQKNSNFWEKLGATLLETQRNVGVGLAKGVEGIVDFGANIVGGVGSLFSKDFQKGVSEWVAKDLSEEYVGKKFYDKSFSIFGDDFANKYRDISYSNDFFDGVVTSVGQMLPAIGAAAVTGGGSLVALGVTGVSSAGSGTQQALQEGATQGKATLYGILEGAKEAGTEYFGGRILGKVAGTSGKVFGVVGGKTADVTAKTTGLSLVKQFAKDSLEEGAEEVLGSILEPFIQKTYKEGSPIDLFNENGGFKGLIQDFAAGTVAAGILGGANLGYKISKYGVENTKLMSDVSKINELSNEAERAYFEGRNTDYETIMQQRQTLLNSATQEAGILLEKYKNLAKTRAKTTLSINENLQRQQNVDIRKQAIQKGFKSNNIEFGVENKYDPTTDTITIKESDLGDYKKTSENFIHEFTHKNTSENLVDTIIKNTENYESKYQQTYDLYKDTIKETQEYKSLIEEGYTQEQALEKVAPKYINEEIAANELSQQFNNLSEFKASLENASRSKISKLLNKIKSIFKGRKKPNNYDEIVKELTTIKQQKAQEIRYKIEKNDIRTINDNNIIETDAKGNTSINEETILTNEKIREKFEYDMSRPQEKKNIKTVFNEISQGIFNAQHTLEINLANKILEMRPELNKAEARELAEIQVQNVRNASKKAQSLIENGIIDEKGNRIIESLNDIIDFKDNEVYLDFQTYMYHQRNIDSMTIEERIGAKRKQELEKVQEQLDFNKETLQKLIERRKSITDKTEINKEIKSFRESIKNLEKEINARNKVIDKLKNKPIFDEKYTAENSRQAIQEIFNKNVEYQEMFEEKAQQIYDMMDYILEDSVKSGRMSISERDLFKEYYPHYIPAYRVKKPQSTQGMTKAQAVRTFKEAKGGSDNLYALDLQIKRYVMQNTKANAFNELGKLLAYGEYQRKSKPNWEGIIGNTQFLPENIDTDNVNNVIEKEGNYTFSFYDNNFKETINIDKETYQGLADLQQNFDELDPTNFIVMKAVGKFMQFNKNLITEYNPFFTVRNFIRDLQDVMFNTKYGFIKSVAELPKTLKSMVKKDVDFQLFIQNGGLGQSQFDTNVSVYKQLEKNMTKKNLSKWKKANPIHWISAMNHFVEIIPRYNEYRMSIKAQQKLGVEKIDYNRAVYDAQEITLNFGRRGGNKIVQGINRYLVPFFNATIQGSRKIMKLFLNAKSKKAIIMLLLKAVGIGMATALFNNLLYGDDDDYQDLSNYDKDNFYLIKIGGQFIKIPKGRLIAMIGGLTNQQDKTLKDNVESMWETLSPVQTFRTIFAPITDVSTNTTWYGSTLVGSQYDNVRAKNQYDENTSAIAKGLGKVFNYSPIKIDYLLEQYTGVVGDLVLPITSQKGSASIGSTITQPTLNQFLVDPVTSNGNSSRFYDYMQEIQYQSNEGSLQAKAELKYLNKIKTQVNEIYTQIDEIENSSLSKSEKNAQVRVLKGSINAIYKQAIETSKQLREVLNQKELDSENYEDNYYVSLYQVLGAENTLKIMDTDTYEKSVELNALGIDYDTYFAYYMETKGFDKEYKQEYIQHMNLKANQKYLLYLISGYSIPDSKKNSLRSYIKTNKDISDEYKEKLLNKLN